MSKMTMKYEGDLELSVRHELSGVEIKTDAPPDNRGKGRSFSPTDLMATSIASCYLTLMGIGADEMGVDITGMSADVEKIMVNEPTRRIGEVKVDVQMPAGIPEDKREDLIAWAKKCPVCKTLSPELKVTVNYNWP